MLSKLTFATALKNAPACTGSAWTLLPKPTVNYSLLHSDFYASTLKMQGEARNCKKGVWTRFTHNCAHCACTISLKIWPTPHYLLLNIVTFMLQTLKMQGEARNCKKKRFGTLRALLCTLRAQDQLENFTNCPLLIATHSDFYASTLKNARGCQKWKEAFCVLRARLCTLHAQDQLENLTNCPSLIATHSYFYAELSRQTFAKRLTS